MVEDDHLSAGAAGVFRPWRTVSRCWRALICFWIMASLRTRTDWTICSCSAAFAVEGTVRSSRPSIRGRVRRVERRRRRGEAAHDSGRKDGVTVRALSSGRDEACWEKGGSVRPVEPSRPRRAPPTARPGPVFERASRRGSFLGPARSAVGERRPPRRAFASETVTARESDSGPPARFRARRSDPACRADQFVMARFVSPASRVPSANCGERREGGRGSSARWRGRTQMKRRGVLLRLFLFLFICDLLPHLRRLSSLSQ